MRNPTDVGAIGFALGGVVTTLVFVAAIIGGTLTFNGPAVEDVALTEPVFSAYTIDVNSLLERPFTDAQVECVVIHAQTWRSEILMAGPCVTTYP